MVKRTACANMIWQHFIKRFKPFLVSLSLSLFLSLFFLIIPPKNKPQVPISILSFQKNTFCFHLFVASQYFIFCLSLLFPFLLLHLLKLLLCSSAAAGVRGIEREGEKKAKIANSW